MGGKAILTKTVFCADDLKIHAEDHFSNIFRFKIWQQNKLSNLDVII